MTARHGLRSTVDRELRTARPWEAGEPLWRRAPVRDEQGRLLSDFMMIIRRLNRRPPLEIRRVLGCLEAVLVSYGRTVVFADFNMRTNLLWVSVRPVPGICLELPAVIHHYVPEARLVNHWPGPVR